MTGGVYRRVHVAMWSDARFRRLSPLRPSAQALWLYATTGPHTCAIPGVFVAGRAAMAEALDWPQEDFDRSLAELVDAGLVEFDRGARLWFIPEELRRNPPQSLPVVKSWKTAWSLLPECDLRESIADRMLAVLSELDLGPSFVETFKTIVYTASPKASNKAPDEPASQAKPEPHAEAQPEASAEPRAIQQQQQQQDKQQHQHQEQQQQPEAADAAADAAPPSDAAFIFDAGLQLLTNAGATKKAANSFLGQLLKDHGAPAVREAIEACERAPDPITSPQGWIRARLLKRATDTTRPTGPAARAASNYAAGALRDATADL